MSADFISQNFAVPHERMLKQWLGLAGVFMPQRLVRPRCLPNKAGNPTRHPMSPTWPKSGAEFGELIKKFFPKLLWGPQHPFAGQV